MKIRNGQYFLTSESVSRGHPDKICDQVSDMLLDLYLAQDPNVHTGIETLATTDQIIIAGEVKGPKIATEIIEKNIRSLIKDIGYEQEHFHHATFKLMNLIHEQSVDICQGVSRSKPEETGAGDQGIMFGYACSETDTYMPAPLYWAHRILENLDAYRRTSANGKLGPDAKTQLTFIYEKEKPVAIQTIVLSTQHHQDMTLDNVKELVIPVIQKTLPADLLSAHTPKYLINPTGRFVIGGPDGDCGLTGRKIIVDSYGGAALHGGGAFSGKDPTKVDRSAAYAARYIAKNIVAAGIAKRCSLQLSYGIGIARPLSLFLDFHHTGKLPESIVEQHILKHLPLTPHWIINHLQLCNPIYLATAAYGHFGRKHTDSRFFTWEKCDLLDLFRDI